MTLREFIHWAKENHPNGSFKRLSDGLIIPYPVANSILRQVLNKEGSRDGLTFRAHGRPQLEVVLLEPEA